MDTEDNFSGGLPVTFPGTLDYSIDDHDHHHQQLMKTQIGQTSVDHNTHHMVDYMFMNNPHQHHMSSGFCSSASLEKLSFADVMQFADFGPKLALTQTSVTEEEEEEEEEEVEETGIDPVYFLKFPVLNDHHKLQDESVMVLSTHQLVGEAEEREEDEREDEEVDRGTSENTSVQLGINHGENSQKSPVPEAKNKRKRPRTIKTTEEVESQRMTHIAVERNRRKQMNEHLRVLRSLMPGSYVQRGDQASIIGGAIEFVRELEQLLQCLESQKRRRLYDDPSRPMGDSSALAVVQQQQPPFFPAGPVVLPNDHQLKFVDLETGLREETAESKSCLANVEVKLLGFDAMIKILSRRKPCQLVRTIAALEDLQLNILHTNITTIDQTVLYSFNVKVAGEVRFTAEDIASSVQEIFSFLHANSSI